MWDLQTIKIAPDLLDKLCADFVGTDISSDTYDRVMDETEAQMPDEEFERFWEKYI